MPRSCSLIDNVESKMLRNKEGAAVLQNAVRVPTEHARHQSELFCTSMPEWVLHMFLKDV